MLPGTGRDLRAPRYSVMQLSGSVVLVTGGSSGVGAATVREMAAAGARVLIAGRDRARLRALAAETGGVALEADLAAPGGPATLADAALIAAAALRTSTLSGIANCAPARAGDTPIYHGAAPATGRSPDSQADLLVSRIGVARHGGPPSARAPLRIPANIASVAIAAAALADPAVTSGDALISGAHHCGLLAASAGIDVLVNNAGLGHLSALEEMSEEKVARLIAVNLTAPIELTRLLVPGMAARGRGCVLFVASIAGETGVRREAVYSAAKSGLACFAESLRYELIDHGIGISVIVPGPIDTPFFDRRGSKYERNWPTPISAQRVAHAIVTAAEREQAVVFVPRWMRFPAWLRGAAPWLFRLLARRFG